MLLLQLLPPEFPVFIQRQLEELPRGYTWMRRPYFFQQEVQAVSRFHYLFGPANSASQRASNKASSLGLRATKYLVHQFGFAWVRKAVGVPRI